LLPHYEDPDIWFMVHGEGTPYTPLRDAVRLGHLEITRLLLKHGADPNLNFAAGDTDQPLWQAVHDGRVDLATVLLEAGADANILAGHEGNLLHELTWPKPFPRRVELGRLLLQHGIEASKRTNKGYTPLHVAAITGDVEFASMLLKEATIDVDAWDAKDRTTPFMIAALAGHLAMLRLLQANGARWDVADARGVDAFFSACHTGQLLAASYILGLGADINRKRANGWTALHCAGRTGNLDTVQFLLHAGADREVKATTAFSEKEQAIGTAAEIARAMDFTHVAGLIDENAPQGKFEVSWKD
jgi:ankyrin repeat protein